MKVIIYENGDRLFAESRHEHTKVDSIRVSKGGWSINRGKQLISHSTLDEFEIFVAADEKSKDIGQ